MLLFVTSSILGSGDGLGTVRPRLLSAVNG
jgi:hypothetical protein